MTRSIRKPRFPFNQRGLIGDLNLIHRSFVNAGESIKKIETRARMQSLPVNHSLSGATIDVWYFMIPVRVLWTDFPEYLMQTDGETYALPVQVDNDMRFFQASNQASFVTTAYETVVNHYFRDEHDDPYVYAHDGDMAVMPIVDQTFEASGSTEYDELDETVDVSGGTLSLAALADARQKLRYERKRDGMSGHYEDFLKAQGVRTNGNVVDGPEMLGHYRKFVWPQKTIDQTSGFTVQSYAHDYHMKLTKARYVTEHSVVIGVMSVRPKVLPYGVANLETEWADPKCIPQVGQLPEHKKLNMAYAGSTQGEDVHRTVDDYLWRGSSLTRSMPSTAMVKTFNPSMLAEIRFPSALWRGFVADKTPLDGDDYVVDGVANMMIATPLRRNRA